MKNIRKYKRIYLLILIPVSVLITLTAKYSSFFAEQIYAKGIYKFISQIYSAITGLLPFSIAELLIIILPAIAIALIIRFIILMIVNKQKRRERFIKGMLNVLCTISILYFMFLICGGLNYYRYSFADYSKLTIEKSSVDDLYGLTKSLALQADEIRSKIKNTDNYGVFQLSENKYNLAKQAKQAFQSLGKDYPILKGNYGAPKPVLLSKLMSQTEITGIFMPFTMEANVNVDIPDYNIPFTMLHELAHLHGFMREDEANYLAYLAGMKSDNIEFHYSSTMLALVMAGNALYQSNPDLYSEVTNLYSEGVKKDFRNNSTYWAQFDNKTISTVSNKINDTYLKANSQTDGVRSYDRMLDLLLAQYRKDHSDSAK
jgi:hypothetical protein